MLRSLLFFFLLPSSVLFSAQLGYYSCWDAGLPPEKIDFRQFTHLVHAFATMDGGTVHVCGNLPSRVLTGKAHAEKVRVLLAVGGSKSGPGFSTMIHDPSLFKECVKRLVDLVMANGYDGIDVDWEFPEKAEKQNVVEFVRALRLELNRANPQALLTMALPATAYYGSRYDGPQLAPLVDFVQVMTYDLHGPSRHGLVFSHSGHNSPLHETDTDPIDGKQLSFTKSVDYWCANGFPKEKLLVGIPLYGHGFAVNEWGKTPTVAAPHPDITFKKIQALLDKGWVRHWDAMACVPWIQSPAGEPLEIISYDDAKSAALKGRWARAAGLGGYFFWEISQDLVNGRNVLVQAARNGYDLPPLSSH